MTEGTATFYVASSTQEIIECTMNLDDLAVRFGSRRSLGRSINSILCFEQHLAILSYSDGFSFVERTNLELLGTGLAASQCSIPQKFFAGQDASRYSPLVVAGRDSSTAVCRFADDIPFSIEFKTDQIFRGSTGMWLLREFSSDEEQSTLVVSFVNNTTVFKVNRAGPICLEEASQFYGIETGERTLAIKNAEGASLLIQVCIDRIRLCKSNRSDIDANFLADWRGSSSVSEGVAFSAAQICKDAVFGLDPVHSKLHVLNCRATRNAASVSLVATMTTPQGVCALDVVSLSDPRQTPESPRLHSPPHTKSFILALAGNSLESGSSAVEIFLLDILESSCRVEKVAWAGFTDFTVNQIRLWGERERTYLLLLGGRDGRLLTRRLSVADDGTVDLSDEHQPSFSVGCRPVQFQQAPQGLTVLSGGAHIFQKNGASYSVQKLVPRADHIVWWSRNSECKNLFCSFIIEHEFLASGATPLATQPRFDRLMSIPNLRHAAQKSNVGLLIVAGNSREADGSPSSLSSAPFVEAYNIQDEELVYRTTFSIGDSITCLCAEGNTDFIMVGVQFDQVGQLCILHMPSEKHSSRRPSAVTKSTPSFIFGPDVGFPHKVRACELLENLCSDGGLYALVAAGTDLHVIGIDLAAEKISFILTESWRAEILSICVNRTMENSTFAVITSRGGLEIYKVALMDPDRADLRQIWTDTSLALFDRLLWCDATTLAATDRRGFVHIFKFTADLTVTKRVVELGDIPISISKLDTENAVLISTITGAVLQVPFLWERPA